MKSIIDKLNEAFLPKNLECDGGACMGCWKDVIREAIKMIEESNCTPKQDSDSVECHIYGSHSLNGYRCPKCNQSTVAQ